MSVTATDNRRVTRSQTVSQKKAALTIAAKNKLQQKKPMSNPTKPVTTKAKAAVAKKLPSQSDEWFPTEFQFAAPNNVQSFSFKPLSPGKAAMFLLGKSTVEFSPMTNRRYIC